MHTISYIFFRYEQVIETWVEQYDGSEAAQLCFVHLHISHFIDELRKNPKNDTFCLKYSRHIEKTTLIPLNPQKYQLTCQIWRRPRHSAHSPCVK